MRILLLSPYPQRLLPALERAGETVLYNDNYADMRLLNPTIDWIISFGYHKIIKEPTLSQYKDRIINIHLSLLPWNRGADPNFWSWFDDTPKGITIHRIDAGVDTGNSLVQLEILRWRRGETLKTSWEYLMDIAIDLFEENWPSIRLDRLPTRKVEGNGSYHVRKDKCRWFDELPLGYDTPCSHIRKLGRAYRKAQDPQENRHPRPRKYRQQAFKEL